MPDSQPYSLTTKHKAAIALCGGLLGLALNLVAIPVAGGHGASIHPGIVAPYVIACLLGPWFGLAAGLLAGLAFYSSAAWIPCVAVITVAVGFANRLGYFATPISALCWATAGSAVAFLAAGSDSWQATAFGWLLSGFVAGIVTDAVLAVPSLGTRFGERSEPPDMGLHLGPALTVASLAPLLLFGIVKGADALPLVLVLSGLSAAAALVGAFVLGKRVTEPIASALDAALSGTALPADRNVYLDIREVADIGKRVAATREQLVETIDSLALRLAERETAYSELLRLSETLEERVQLRGIEVEQREFLLSLSQKHYREVVEQASDIIYELDLQGKFTTINAAGEKFFGHGLPYLVGKFWHETLAPGYDRSLGEGDGFRDILEVLHNKQRFLTTTVHEASGGEIRLLETRLELVRDEEGLPIRISGISRDVTEIEGFQREIEKLGKTLVRVQHSLNRREREINALLSASRAINSELEVDQLLQHIIESGAAQIKAESGFVGLLDEGALKLSWYWRASGASWVDLEHPLVEAGVTQIVLQDRQPYLCANAADDPNTDKEFTRRFGVRSLLVLPIFSQASTVIGAMALHNFPITEKAGDSGDDIGIEPKDMRFLEGLTDLASAAIQQARLFDQVRQQAETDGLTALFNRRAFEARLTSEIERAIRFNRTFALLLIDLDHLKKINDTYGHQIGDAAICTVADVLQGRLRRHDFAARIGGEEFAVLLIEAKPETAINVGKILLDTLRRRDVPRVGHISASLGIAMFPDDARDGDELFRMADQALYHAKNTGRDRVVMYKKIDTGDLGSPT